MDPQLPTIKKEHRADTPKQRLEVIALRPLVAHSYKEPVSKYQKGALDQGKSPDAQERNDPEAARIVALLGVRRFTLI